jgi:hypothetical protein
MKLVVERRKLNVEKGAAAGKGRKRKKKNNKEMKGIDP